MMPGKLLSAIAQEFAAFIRAVAVHWPSDYVGMALRARYYGRALLGNLGARPRIGIGTVIIPHPRLTIGDDFIVGRNAYVSAEHSFGVAIGNDVIMAQGVFIRGANHAYFDLDRPINAQGHFARKVAAADGAEYSIVIEDDVWVGVNAMILSGARIGRGSVVGAGAVVTALDAPPYSIIAGNPARVIGDRRDRRPDDGIALFPPDSGA